MKPSEMIKAAGLKNMKEMSELVQVPVGTLISWHENRPVLFNRIVKSFFYERKLTKISDVILEEHVI